MKGDADRRIVTQLASINVALWLIAWCAVVAVVILLAGCADVTISEPECSDARPQDCEYLLKVHGEKEW